MLNIDEATLDRMERADPGIRQTILYLEAASLPACSRCGSQNTADVGGGIVGRTFDIAAATTKFKLVANGPKPGNFFCNACEAFFD